jgi:hypothetical protein
LVTDSDANAPGDFHVEPTDVNNQNQIEILQHNSIYTGNGVYKIEYSIKNISNLNQIKLIKNQTDGLKLYVTGLMVSEAPSMPYADGDNSNDVIFYTKSNWKQSVKFQMNDVYLESESKIRFKLHSFNASVEVIADDQKIEGNVINFSLPDYFFRMLPSGSYAVDAFVKNKFDMVGDSSQNLNFNISEFPFVGRLQEIVLIGNQNTSQIDVNSQKLRIQLSFNQKLNEQDLNDVLIYIYANNILAEVVNPKMIIQSPVEYWIDFNAVGTLSRSSNDLKIKIGSNALAFSNEIFFELINPNSSTDSPVNDVLLITNSNAVVQLLGGKDVLLLAKDMQLSQVSLIGFSFDYGDEADTLKIGNLLHNFQPSGVLYDDAMVLLSKYLTLQLIGDELQMELDCDGNSVMDVIFKITPDNSTFFELMQSWSDVKLMQYLLLNHSIETSEFGTVGNDLLVLNSISSIADLSFGGSDIVFLDRAEGEYFILNFSFSSYSAEKDFIDVSNLFDLNSTQISLGNKPYNEELTAYLLANQFFDASLNQNNLEIDINFDENKSIAIHFLGVNHVNFGYSSFNEYQIILSLINANIFVF